MGIEFPNVGAFFAEAQETRRSKRAIENQIEIELEEFRRELLSVKGVELPAQAFRNLQRRARSKKGVEALDDKLAAAQASAESAVAAFAQSVWQGEAGRGELVVMVYDSGTYPGQSAGSKVTRVVVLNAGGARLLERLRRDPWVTLNSGRFADRLELLSPGRPFGVDEWHTAPPSMGEVDPGEVSMEDLDALFLRVREWHSMKVTFWAAVGMWPCVLRQVRPLDQFPMRSCHHHDDFISADWKFLPTRNWALCVDWSGGFMDDTVSTRFCTHVVQDPLPVMAHVRSTSLGWLTVTGLEQAGARLPTEAEMEFLQQNEFPYRPLKDGDSGPVYTG